MTRGLRVVACRNQHCLLFGFGWPSIALGVERRVYVYAGPWLITVTLASGGGGSV